MEPRLVCYYAHCLSLYDTPQEERDVFLLKRLGFEVSNPNTPEITERIQTLSGEDKMHVMEIVFKPLVRAADVFAFRALPDGMISSGAYRELIWARVYDKPIFELPSSVRRRELSLPLTREYLREVGQR